MISTKPCGITVQAAPDANVCDDCQGIRALCGVSPCPHAPPFAAGGASRDANMFDVAAFTAWLEASGRAPSTAKNITAAARNAVRAGARSPDDVTAALFPDLKETTIEKYRQAMEFFAAWKRGDEPLPLQKQRKTTVSAVVGDDAPLPAAPPPPVREDDPAEPTITLTIPVAWVESVAADRSGYRIAIDVIDDPWLRVDEKTFELALAAMSRQ